MLCSHTGVWIWMWLRLDVVSNFDWHWRNGGRVARRSESVPLVMKCVHWSSAGVVWRVTWSVAFLLIRGSNLICHHLAAFFLWVNGRKYSELRAIDCRLEKIFWVESDRKSSEREDRGLWIIGAHLEKKNWKKKIMEGLVANVCRTRGESSYRHSKAYHDMNHREPETTWRDCVGPFLLYFALKEIS